MGNAYVNRPITGAIVGRQPFGGWKRSVVGPGAKAGGPNYVLQLCRDRGRGPGRPRAPSRAPHVRALLDALADAAARRRHCRSRPRPGSDAHWWSSEFAVDHDPAGLFCESNVLRYRPFRASPCGWAPTPPPFDVARVLLAAAVTGVAPAVSLHPDAGVPR